MQGGASGISEGGASSISEGGVLVVFQALVAGRGWCFSGKMATVVWGGEDQ